MDAYNMYKFCEDVPGLFMKLVVKVALNPTQDVHA